MAVEFKKRSQPLTIKRNVAGENFTVSIMWLSIVLVAVVINPFGEAVPLANNGIVNRLTEFDAIGGGLVPIGQGRIVGGTFVPITTVPWTISLQRLGSHRCGGAIISPTVALTAAHCTNHIPGNGFYIRAGSDTKNRDGQLIPTRDVAIHPSFNETILEHDICVVFMESPFNTALPGIAIIPMTSGGSSLPSGTMSTVSGWGPLYENGSGSEVLRSVTHPVFSSLECSQRHGPTTHDMLCAGLDAGGAAACDPGSPLVSGGVLVGVMSWSIGCGRPVLPSIFSRVSTARLWIDFAMNSNL